MGLVADVSESRSTRDEQAEGGQAAATADAAGSTGEHG
jgi:hypothetical protein